MRRIPKPRDPVLFSLLAVVLASVVISALYFTRGRDPGGSLGRRPVVKAEIVMWYDEPGVDGKSAWHSLDTDSPAQIQELLALVKRYPYNQKIDFSRIRLFTEPTTTMWVNLACAPEDGKTAWTQELVYSNGYMAAALSDGKLFSCGVGRFGASRTKEYYARLNSFFLEKEKSPEWKTGQDIQKPGGMGE